MVIGCCFLCLVSIHTRFHYINTLSKLSKGILFFYLRVSITLSYNIIGKRLMLYRKVYIVTRISKNMFFIFRIYWIPPVYYGMYLRNTINLKTFLISKKTLTCPQQAQWVFTICGREQPRNIPVCQRIRLRLRRPCVGESVT